MKLKTLNFCLLLAGLTTSSHGALSFTQNFTSGTSPNMTLGTPFGTPITNFTNAFNITSGDGNRIYLGTNDTDYSSVDFSFEADVVVPANNSPWAITFIGMGSPNTGPASEPVSGSNISMLARNDNSNLENLDNGSIATSKTGVGVINGTHGIRMEWNATTKLATFLFDVGNDGTYDPTLTFTVNGADNGFNATNSRLFLGGGAGLSFDNIVVNAIPEPSAALLGGLGVLGLLRRRRA